MTMKEVVQEYCRMKQVDSATAILLHKGKTVDLSLPFRLTGLNNNAVLTLGRRASNMVQACTVALQLEDGTRVQNKFQVTYSLWQVLRGFEEFTASQGKPLVLTSLMAPEPASDEKRTGFMRLSKAKEGPVGWMQPVLTLLNKRFETVEDLTSTTLQFLGATGSCLVRINFKWTPATEPPVVNVSAAEPVKQLEQPKAAVAPEVLRPAGDSTTPSANGGNDNNAPTADSNNDARPIKSQKTAEEENVESADEQVSVAVIPADRNALVLEPSDSPFNAAEFEVPDDFFNLKPQDLAMMKQIAGKADAPLMTREFREKKQLAAYSKFSKTSIRVRFPDRWELQGTFLGTEGPMDLIEFVSGFLETPDREFLLYTTPPKQNLENRNFLQQKLMPAAVVYFAWCDKDGPNVFLSSQAKANAATLKDGKHLTTFTNSTPLDYHAAVKEDVSSGKGKDEASDKPAGDASKKKKGVPSWLKLGK